MATQNETTVRSTIVTLSNGDKFIEPMIQDLCPELYKLGSKDSFSNKYHLEELYNLLFRSANHASTSPYFKKDNKFSRSMREDISYHIYEMLDHKEKRTTIIDLCNKFEDLCKQFLTNTHPLSLRLIDEINSTKNINGNMGKRLDELNELEKMELKKLDELIDSMDDILKKNQQVSDVENYDSDDSFSDSDEQKSEEPLPLSQKDLEQKEKNCSENLNQIDENLSYKSLLPAHRKFFLVMDDLQNQNCTGYNRLHV